MTQLESDTIFKFEFTSYGCKNKNLSHKVYSNNKEDMILFLQQHSFDMSMVHIECLTIDEYEKEVDGHIYDYLLKGYKMRSNKSQETFMIMTTYDFVYQACEVVCSWLSDSLLFGPPILRTDVEIIKMINDLIHELPHVFVLDHALIDGDSGNIIGDQRYIRSNRSLDSFDLTDEGYDDSYIYESIFNSSFDEDIQPITVEAYVSFFTTLIMDVYE